MSIVEAILVQMIVQRKQVWMVFFQNKVSDPYSNHFSDTIEYFEIELKYCGCKRRIKKFLFNVINKCKCMTVQ